MCTSLVTHQLCCAQNYHSYTTPRIGFRCVRARIIFTILACSILSAATLIFPREVLFNQMNAVIRCRVTFCHFTAQLNATDWITLCVTTISKLNFKTCCVRFVWTFTNIALGIRINLHVVLNEMHTIRCGPNVDNNKSTKSLARRF